MFLELSGQFRTATARAPTRKIFLDLCGGPAPDRTPPTQEIFLDLSGSTSAHANTTRTRKIFLDLSGFRIAPGSLAEDQQNVPGPKEESRMPAVKTMFVEVSRDSVRLRVDLEVCELRQHIERLGVLWQSLCDQIDSSR
jgi:hypothetical protein